MTDKVKHIVPATISPDPDVINVCERLLEKAKSGELRSIVAAGALTENRFHTVIETHDMIESIGLVTMMQWRLGAMSERTKEGG